MNTRFTISLYIFSLLAFNVWCIDFNFTSFMGATTGAINEYVIEDDHTISRLDWTQKIIPIIGAEIECNIKGFVLQIGIISAIPIKCGTMEDFDFLLTDSTQVSQYSFHDNYLDKFIEFNAKIGYEIKIKNFFIQPQLYFHYRNQKWSARDGYLQYPVFGAWTGKENKTSVSGNIISYEQSILIPSLCLSQGFFVSNILHFELICAYIPYLWAKALDSHYLRSKQFYDILDGGDGFSLGFCIKIKKFSFFFNYEQFYIDKGSTFTGNIGIDSNSLIKDETVSSAIKSYLIKLGIGISF